MKTDRAPIWKNSLFLFITQAIRLLTNIFIAVGIARLYGPEAFGQFSIAYTIATICIVIADFGFGVLLTTEIANNRNNAAIIGKKYFSMKIIFALLSSAIMITIPSFQTFSIQSRTLIYTLTLFVVFTTFTNFFNAIFRGFEKFNYETRISFITNLIFLILLVFLGILKIQLIYLMLLFVVTRLLGVILSVQKAISLVGTNFIGIDFKEWRTIVNRILIYGLHFIFGNLFFQLDTVLIGMWKSDNDVGIYKSAFNIMLLILMLSDIAFSAILPLLSRLYYENTEKWKIISRLYFKVFLLTALPISIVVFFYSEQIISIIYGHKLYKEAIPILKIFSIVILFRFIGEPYAMIITTSRRQHFSMIIVIAAAVASFVLNFFVIPKYGLSGAALVSLGVNLFVVAAYFIVVKFSFFKWLFELRIIAVLSITTLLVLLLWYSNAQLIVLFVSAIIYILIAYLIGFSNEDRKIIFSNLKLKSI
ncbi:MAG: flippase [Melioribacteraceae bacterium]